MKGDLKLTFMNQCLQQYMEAVIDRQRAAMVRTKAIDTGAGYNSLDFRVSNTGSANVTGQLFFLEYLRFVDMGVRKGHPIGKTELVRAEIKRTKISGAILQKDRTVKPKKIYSKPAYGLLSWLYGKLIYGFTDEVIAALKAEAEANVQM